MSARRLLENAAISEGVMTTRMRKQLVPLHYDSSKLIQRRVWGRVIDHLFLNTSNSFPTRRCFWRHTHPKIPNSFLRFLHLSHMARNDRCLRISQPFQIMSSFSPAVARREHLDACYLIVGINLSVLRISGTRGSLAAV